MVVGFMTKEERGEGMRRCRNLRTTTTTARRKRRGISFIFRRSNTVDLLVSGFGQIYLMVKYI